MWNLRINPSILRTSVYGSGDYYNVGTSILFTYTWQWVFLLTTDAARSPLLWNCAWRLSIVLLEADFRTVKEQSFFLRQDLILSNPYIRLFGSIYMKTLPLFPEIPLRKVDSATMDELFNTLIWASIKIIQGYVDNLIYNVKLRQNEEADARLSHIGARDMVFIRNHSHSLSKSPFGSPVIDATEIP